MTKAFTRSSEPTAGDPGLLNRIAWSLRWQDRAKSVDFATSADAISGQGSASRDRFNRGCARRTLSWQALWRGDFDTSLRRSLEVESFLCESKYPDERAYNYSILGVLHYSRGRLDLATCAVERGLAIADHTRDAESFVDLLTTQAGIACHKGDYGKAGLTLGRAEQIAEGNDQTRIQYSIARWLLEDGCPDKAADRASRALALAEEHRTRVIEPYACAVMGSALMHEGFCDQAETYFRRGIAIGREDEDRRAQCQILRAYGELEAKRGNRDRALELYREGARIAGQMKYLIWQVRFARERAGLFEAKGDLKSALAEQRLAWALADRRRA